MGIVLLLCCLLSPLVTFSSQTAQTRWVMLKDAAVQATIDRTDPANLDKQLVVRKEGEESCFNKSVMFVEISCTSRHKKKIVPVFALYPLRDSAGTDLDNLYHSVAGWKRRGGLFLSCAGSSISMSVLSWIAARKVPTLLVQKMFLGIAGLTLCCSAGAFMVSYIRGGPIRRWERQNTCLELTVDERNSLIQSYRSIANNAIFYVPRVQWQQIGGANSIQICTDQAGEGTFFPLVPLTRDPRVVPSLFW